MRRLSPLLLLALALPAPALAQTSTEPAGPAAATPAPASAPTAPKKPTAKAEPKAKVKPRAASGRLVVRVERVGRDRTVLAGQRFRVRGALRPHVAGQKVVVRMYSDGRKVAAKSVSVQRVNASFGRFVVGFTARRSGRIAIRVSHRATAQLGTVVAKAATLRAIAPSTRSRPAVRWLQGRLKALGYVTPRSGSFDNGTQRAVMAFRKVTGMRRTFAAGSEVFRALARGRGAFRVRFPRHGRHVEADISRQVLALVGRGGKVERIYHTSTGAPSTPTILGSFRVYRKQPGTNAKGMVHSSYFIRGYAVHGYQSVPPYNASHGCLRVPIPNALSIFRWMVPGTIVDTYR